MAAAQQRGKSLPILYDRWLLLAAIGLLVVGLLMVASSSIAISYRQFNSPFYYLLRQACFLAVGIVAGLIIIRFPIEYWYRLSASILFLSFVALLLVLIPGIGHQVNGSNRWLSLGPIGFQVSEFAKMGFIIYLASYLVRHQEAFNTKVIGFIKPMLVLGVIGVFLLQEPDFGSAVVICATSMGVMFLAGVRMKHFLALILFVLAILVVVAISSPYRMLRLTTFLNPWANPFHSGYQLTQSLIAFGRGGWLGVGLGESVQKLFYLPEAHTDFIFAVLAEELGLLGIIFMMGLYILLFIRILNVAKQAHLMNELFSAYLAYGLGLWIALQFLINIGVNTGVLPTKGLTLPFISYGGSSLLIMCIVLALLLRVDYEVRLRKYGFATKTNSKRRYT